MNENGQIFGEALDLRCPLALFGITKDPNLQVLGFHHKQAIPRDDDLIGLGGPVNSHFDQMNSEWKDVVNKVKSNAPLAKTSDEVRNTVAAWHQEQRDLCLIMSRLTSRGKNRSVPVFSWSCPGFPMTETATLNGSIRVRALQDCR